MILQPLYSFGKFFSLETLDKRLIPSTTTSSQARKTISKAHKSRWNTPEFYLYYLVFIVVIPLMFKTAMEASNETNSNYWIYEKILSPGWINGRQVDNSDAQYRFFRNNFPLLMALMGAHVLVKRFTLKYILNNRNSDPTLKFDLVFGCIFLFAAHGFNSIRILFHLLINYTIGKFFVIHRDSQKMAILFTWTYGILTLFINDKWRLFQFGSILAPLSFLDSFKGIVERWDVFYNFTLLRMLSFNLDYIKRYYALKEQSGLEQKEDVAIDDVSQDSGSEIHNKSEKQEQDLGPGASHGSSTGPGQGQDSVPVNSVVASYLSDRERLDAPLSITDYNMSNYLSYITYTPLFIAGPILTFNDYIYQSRNTSPTITYRMLFKFALRFAVCVLTMEFILHYIYVVAVSKAKAWHNDTPFQISMIGLFNLNIIWLKLLIPWRFFRMWSLLDNIDPPENMIRCMNNNNSAVSFWRAWHRSLSRWSIRYIYIPLGGDKNRILTSLCVFSFVAIWHDIQLKLLLWGWLVVLFLLPEIVVSKIFRAKVDQNWKGYRHLACLGGVINIWMMMIANLFGFCLGIDGTKNFLQSLFQSLDGVIFFITSSACLFVAVQIQNELREHEKRKGIDLRC